MMKERMLRKYKKLGNSSVSFLDFCKSELSKHHIVKNLSGDEKELALTLILTINGIYEGVSE